MFASMSVCVCVYCDRISTSDGGVGRAPCHRKEVSTALRLRVGSRLAQAPRGGQPQPQHRGVCGAELGLAGGDGEEAAGPLAVRGLREEDRAGRGLGCWGGDCR